MSKNRVNAVGCDTSLSLDSWMRDKLQPHTVVQGNLDPMLLLHGGPQLEQRVKRIIETLSGGRHIFNLGHGIIKETPPEHVTQLMEYIRGSAGLALDLHQIVRAYGTDFDMDGYLWLKAAHVISIIAWMAGLVYLPRLFVYHAMEKQGLRDRTGFQGHGAQTAQDDHEPGDDC